MNLGSWAILLTAMVWIPFAKEITAQDVVLPDTDSRVELATGKSSQPESSEAATETIVTGYRGHFACRVFSGISREVAIAASDREPQKFKDLINSGADINARASADCAHGMTMLQVAVVHQWGVESIRLLLEAGADIEARDRRGETALTLASQNPAGPSVPVIMQLIAAGAAINAPGSHGMTPLMFAALYDQTGRAVEVLLRASVEVQARDQAGWTALMHAMRRHREQTKIITMLVAAGADVNARHNQGGTPLSLAAYHGHFRSAQLLIAQGSDVNSRDSANWTPLICASINGHLHIAGLLIKAGANVNNADRLGRTALQVARSNGRDAVVQLLARTGAHR